MADRTKGLVQLPAQVVDFRPKADRSYKITFNTRELSGDEVAIIADAFQGEGWLVYKANGGGLEAGEIPQDDADSGLVDKSPSKRLRSVLFLLWQQSGEPMDDFNRWYGGQMDKIINVLKEKLDD